MVHTVSPSGPRVVSQVFQYRPAKARVVQITDPSQLIGGPLAHGRIGDWLIENSIVRFIVQDVAQRDLYSVGAFGGNVIDLELVAKPGTDNFIEIQPMLNVETVINAQTIEVVNDGQDGTAAILRTCGPDDLLDFVNPSSLIGDAGFDVPPNMDDNDQTVEACTEYRLEPLVARLELDTNVTNIGPAEERLLVGDWYNPGGQLEQWNKFQRLGEALTTPFDLISHIGYGEEEGVDYAYTALPLEPPLAGASARPELFTTSGVTVVLHNMGIIDALTGGTPPFFVAPGAERNFRRFLGVGDGSGANGVAMETAVKEVATATVEGCVTVAGVPLEGSRVIVVRRIGTTGTNVPRMYSQFVTKPGPCPNYSGPVEPHSNTRFPLGGEALPVAARPTRAGSALRHSTTSRSRPAIRRWSTSICRPPGGSRAHVVDENGTPITRPRGRRRLRSEPPILGGPGLPGLGSSTLGLFEDPRRRCPSASWRSATPARTAIVELRRGARQLPGRGQPRHRVLRDSAPLTITAGTTTSPARSPACSTRRASSRRTSTCTASAPRTRGGDGPRSRSSRARASTTSS